MRYENYDVPPPPKKNPTKKQGILSILDQNLDNRDFIFICMKLKEWSVLHSHAVMFDI